MIVVIADDLTGAAELGGLGLRHGLTVEIVTDTDQYSQKDLLVIICGSAASWIIDKVVNNKGGLHNRVTKRIRLMPFTLQETEAYFATKKIVLDRYHHAGER